jgi:hypothetical protein
MWAGAQFALAQALQLHPKVRYLGCLWKALPIDKYPAGRVVFGVNGHLHVVAHHSRAFAARRHGASAGISHRELAIRLRLEFAP